MCPFCFLSFPSASLPSASLSVSLTSKFFLFPPSDEESEELVESEESGDNSSDESELDFSMASGDGWEFWLAFLVTV